MTKKETSPPSREVRLQDGSTEGDLETIAFDLYAGGTAQLVPNISKLELVVQLREAKAVRGLCELLRNKLLLDGYLVVDSIDQVQEQWHENQLLPPTEGS